MKHRLIAFLVGFLAAFLLVFGAVEALGTTTIPGKEQAIADQGLMIENDLSLYQITSSPADLQQAQHIAKVFMRSPQQVINELIFIRGLIRLNSVAPIKGFAAWLANYRQFVFTKKRAPGQVWTRSDGLLESTNHGDALERIIYAWPAAQVYTSEIEDSNYAAVAPLRYYFKRSEHAFTVTLRFKHHRAHPLGATFCDDNNWIGLAYESAWRVTHVAQWLTFAKDVAKLENGRCWNRRWGGEAWVLGPGENSLSTDSTAGGEQLDFRLYQDTGLTHYLAYALRADTWLRANMLAPNGGFYETLRYTSKGTEYSTTAAGGGVPGHRAEINGVDPVSLFDARLELEAAERDAG